MNEIRDCDPAKGDLCQGDVILFRLPDGYSPTKTQPIAPRAGQLILAEGEMTGHHHAIWMSPLTFHDGALAREKIQERFQADPGACAVSQVFDAADVASTARLYRDDALTQRLVSAGHLTTAALAIGYLTVEGEPVVLRHEEHDPIRIPPGEFYVGRQQEFHAGEARQVAD